MNRTVSPAAAAPGVDLLALAFTVFNGLRTLAYLPTIWSVVQSGSSDQHALFTWITWCGANATMAAWVYRRNGRCWDRVVLINTANAVLCLATGLVITWYRL
jgi:hypothetical protein